MSQHTKGPWVFSGNWIEAPNAGAFRVRVAIVDDGIGAVPEHNGPLLAASPDLLEALKDMEGVFREGLENGIVVAHEIMSGSLDSLFSKASAAIVKAEGRGE